MLEQTMGDEEMAYEIHNEEAVVVDRNIDVHVASLRKKLGPNFSWIDTVRGIGYMYSKGSSTSFTPF